MFGPEDSKNFYDLWKDKGSQILRNLYQKIRNLESQNTHIPEIIKNYDLRLSHIELQSLEISRLKIELFAHRDEIQRLKMSQSPFILRERLEKSLGGKQFIDQYYNNGGYTKALVDAVYREEKSLKVILF